MVPDFIANAGGVICAAMEYQGATRTVSFATIEDEIRANTRAVLETAKTTRIPPRQAAGDLAPDLGVHGAERRTSDYAPEMLHAAAQGRPYACFVREDTRIPFMAMPDAIRASSP